MSRPLELRNRRLSQNWSLLETLLLHLADLLYHFTVMNDPVFCFLAGLLENSYLFLFLASEQSLLRLNKLAHFDVKLQSLLLNILILGPPGHIDLILYKAGIQTAGSILQHPEFDLFKLLVNVSQMPGCFIEQ